MNWSNHKNVQFTSCVHVPHCIIISPVVIYFFLWLLGNYVVIYDEIYDKIYDETQGLNGAFL